MTRWDFLVVGGGVVGLSMAQELRRRRPSASILLVEKEADVALHASGRNSGVLHAGFYYSADSLKAKLTAEGNRRVKAFCRAQGLELNECGKVVVTRGEAELPALEELKRRGDRNGVRLELIDEGQLREIDPNAKTFSRALHSPDTASIDPGAFCRRLRDVVVSQGVELRLGTRFLGADLERGLVRTDRGELACEYLVNCAGLYADKVAHACGLGRRYTMLPFKGVYLKYLGGKDLLRTNVYPVPDLRNPFLGVHFTKTVAGDVKIGPTAMPAFWREQYGGLENFRLSELLPIGWLDFKLFCLNPFHFRELAFAELRKAVRANLIADARGLVHAMGSGFEPMRPGIRAQLLDLEQDKLVMDFIIEHSSNSTHLLNAVSPAFTCAFTIAEHVAGEIERNRA